MTQEKHPSSEAIAGDAYESLERLVFEFKSTPEGICSSVVNCLRLAPETSHSRGRRAAKDLFAEIARAFLEMMASGKLEEIAEARSLLASALEKEPRAYWYLEDAPIEVQFASQVQVLRSCVDVFLHRSNLAQPLFLLAGARRKAWRQAILAMGSYDVPIRAADLVSRFKVFEQSATAHAALSKLSKFGLVSQDKRSESETFFRLTWQGAQVYQVLLANEETPLLPAREQSRAASPAVTEPEVALSPSEARSNQLVPEVPRFSNQDVERAGFNKGKLLHRLETEVMPLQEAGI